MSRVGRVYRSTDAICSMRRQSFRGASPDRIDFGHGLEARADRHHGVKSDSGFICRVTSTTLSTGKKARNDIVCLARLGMLTVDPQIAGGTEALCGSSEPPNSRTLQLAALQRFAAQP